MQNAYPAIFSWLDQHQEKCKTRYDQGEFWWELRACDYWEEFEKPKILWPGISDVVTAFAYDDNANYGNDNTHLIVTDHKWLLGILNSKLMFDVLHHTVDYVRGGFARLKMSYISQLPIVEPSSADKEVLDRLVGVRMGLDVESGGGGAAEIERVEGEIENLIKQIYGV